MKTPIKSDTERGAVDPAATCSRLDSPADVCLNKRTTWVDFDPAKDVIDLADNHHQIQVTVEHRAWVCPFCEQSTEYWVVNDCVILGCGMSTLMSNGKVSDCCERWECRQKQRKFHGENDQGEGRRKGGSDAN